MTKILVLSKEYYIFYIKKSRNPDPPGSTSFGRSRIRIHFSRKWILGQHWFKSIYSFKELNFLYYFPGVFVVVVGICSDQEDPWE